MREADAFQAVEDAAIDRTIDQTAAGGAFEPRMSRQMNVRRMGAVCRDSCEHRHAPRVHAKQPVAVTDRERPVAPVSRHALVEQTQRGERATRLFEHQMNGTPMRYGLPVLAATARSIVSR